ncbi:glycosyltransferase family 4 protein [Rubripirellula obstinata]|nr:glycosyltransferase family 4 protein [Rubripirellula obstinata]
MNDNAVAKALIGQGVDCLLQPIYTPIRTDQISIASDQVFFGGIEVYLAQKFRWARKLPSPLRRLLNSPSLIRLVTRRTGSTDPILLGQLTTSMLRGTDGNQASEVQRLVDWLADEIQPDAIVLSNLLIGGALPAIRQRLPDVRIAVMLQGDDIFLDHLPQPYQSEAMELCRNLVSHVDHFITHSQFYSDKMGDRFEIPNSKRVEFPLTIDTSPFDGLPDRVAADSHSTGNTPAFKLGYLARIAPEKGLHHLVEAFLSLADQTNIELHVAGWLGEHNQDYFDALKSKVHAAGLTDRFFHHGSPSLAEKVALLGSLDVFSVPTDYHDPKGLFVLESLAAGVPVIQPHHGAFAELINKTGGGVTYPPGDLEAFVAAIKAMMDDSMVRGNYGTTGRSRVLENHRTEQTAKRLTDLLLSG